MKRRDFIQKSSYLAALGLLMPSQLLTAKSHSQNWAIANLGDIPMHIRHGLLAQTEQSQGILSACTWLKNLEINHFVDNPAEENLEVLKHYTINLEGDSIYLGVKGDEVWINSIDSDITQEEKFPFKEQRGKYTVTLQALNNNSNLEFKSAQNTECLVLVLEGEVKLNTSAKTLKMNEQEIFWQENQSLILQGLDKMNRILMIQK